MAPTTRAKPERTMRLERKPTGTVPGLLNITVGKLSIDYALEYVDTDMGDAYRLTKVGELAPDEPRDYHVLLARDGESCECWGFLRWSHCKHVESLQALRGRGDL
jgi:hypothetical protein